MSKNIGEKVVLAAGALATLVLCCRVAQLLWTGAVLTREKLAKSGKDSQLG